MPTTRSAPKKAMLSVSRLTACYPESFNRIYNERQRRRNHCRLLMLGPEEKKRSFVKLFPKTLILFSWDMERIWGHPYTECCCVSEQQSWTLAQRCEQWTRSRGRSLSIFRMLLRNRTVDFNTHCLNCVVLVRILLVESHSFSVSATGARSG